MLSDDQIMIRDTARQFARERLAPSAAERDRTGETPRGLLAEMGALGFMGMTIPEEWGGAGADTVALMSWRWRRLRVATAAFPPS